MMRVTFCHSESGRVEELLLPDADSMQLTYELLRDSNDNTIARFERGLWRRQDTGTFWTDICLGEGEVRP